MSQSHGGGAAASLAEMLEERQYLLEIGMRISGSALTADRIVQETYRRWYTLDDDERATIAVPRAWLTRVAGETCLELLPAAKPVQTSANPAHPSAADLHGWTVRRFAAACEVGDIAELEMLLAASAVVVIDGGGKVRAAIRPLHGASEAARHLAALLAGLPCTVERVNDREGLVVRRAGQAVAVASLNVAGAEVTRMWIVLNPDKLRNWHTVGERSQHGARNDTQRT